MRLIDADAKELEQRIENNFGSFTSFIVKSVLKSATTIDAVTVVRCKDCKHRTRGWKDGVWQCGHRYYGMGCGVELKEDDFCSYGERKDGDG